MYKTFIFDLDGTLLDTIGDLAASVNYALRTNGMPEHSTDDVRRFVGNGVRLFRLFGGQYLLRRISRRWDGI